MLLKKRVVSSRAIQLIELKFVLRLRIDARASNLLIFIRSVITVMRSRKQSMTVGAETMDSRIYSIRQELAGNAAKLTPYGLDSLLPPFARSVGAIATRDSRPLGMPGLGRVRTGGHAAPHESSARPSRSVERSAG